MTRELDPQLIEAAVAGIWDAQIAAETQPHLRQALSAGMYKGSIQHEDAVRDAKASILATDAYRAPLVREAVAGLMSAQGNLIAAYYGEIPVRIDVLRRERDNARTHLLTLLGAQEGDDA